MQLPAIHFQNKNKSKKNQFARSKKIQNKSFERNMEWEFLHLLDFE